MKSLRKSVARLQTVMHAISRQPRHFFRTCEEEAMNLHWVERARALHAIREIRLTDLVHVPEISLETITFRAGGSSVPDHLLLAGLCQSYQACHYFEIGTFLGESIANVSPFCERCVSLSLPDEEFAQTPTLAEQARQVSRMFSRSRSNVIHLYGDSMGYDFGHLNERFDVIFVDGCHDYRYVVSDTRNALRLLRTNQSVIVFHDAKNAYNDIEPEVMVGIYDGLTPDWRPHLYTVENTLCAIVTKRSISSFSRHSLRENPYVKPATTFGLTVRIDKID